MAKARRHRARWLSWAAPPSRWPPGPPLPLASLDSSEVGPKTAGPACRVSGSFSPSCPDAVGSRLPTGSVLCAAAQGMLGHSPFQLGEGAREVSGAACPYCPGLLHGHRDPRPGSGWSLSIQPLLRVHSRAQMSEWEHRVTPPASQRSLSPGRPSFSHVCLLHSARSHGAPPRTGHSHLVPCLPCWWPVGTRPTPDGALGQRSRSKLAVAFGMQRDDRHLLTGG